MKKLFLLTLPALCFLAACGESAKTSNEWFENKEFIQALQSSDSAGVSGIIATSPINIKTADKNGNTPLIFAANSANYDTVKALIKAGINIDAADNNGNTALIAAASNNNDPEIIKQIILSGADINIRNQAGQTAILAAAHNNTNPQILLTLLSAGIDEDRSTVMNALSKNTNAANIQEVLKTTLIPPLIKIPWHNNNSFKRAITENNHALLTREVRRTDISPFKNNLDALGYALTLKTTDLETVKIFLKNGANASANYNAEATPLQLAAANTVDARVVGLLIKSGAKANTVNNKGMTPLYAAIIESTIPEKILPLLIKAGADINTNTLEYPPLATAISLRESEIVPLILVKAGAKINDDGTGKFYPPLLMAVQKSQNEKIIYLLLNSKADTEIKDDRGQAPLLLAMAANPNEKITIALLNASKKLPDINDALQFSAKNKNKKIRQIVSDYYKKHEEKQATTKPDTTNAPQPPLGKNWFEDKAFVSAIQKADIETLRKSLSAGLNLEALMEGKVTALMFAAGMADKEIVIYDLISAGANPNTANANGDTALMTAALVNKNPKIITALLQNGANINAIDSTGGTALMSAVNSNPNEQVTITLLQSGAEPGNKSKILKYAENNKNKKVKEILEQNL